MDTPPSLVQCLPTGRANDERVEAIVFSEKNGLTFKSARQRGKRKMTNRWFEHGIEWDAFSRAITLEHGIEWPSPAFMPGVFKATIERDENFRLQLVADGTLRDVGELIRRRTEIDSIKAGAFLAPTKISLDANGARLDIEMHIDIHPSLVTQTVRERSFQQRARVHRIRRTWSTRFSPPEDLDDIPKIATMGEPAWRSDWYVNGETSFRFTGLTKRQRSAAFARERAFSNVRADEGPTGSGSFDHVVIDTPAVKFAYCRIPKAHAPEELGAISLDFLAPIPSVDVRTGVPKPSPSFSVSGS